MMKKLFWFFIGVLCFFMACQCVNYDYDLFARLIVGERFIEEHILPFNDFLSYTPTHPWYDHEWGSGVIFYAILKYFGNIGLLLFYSFAFLGTAFFIAKTQKLQKHSYPTSLLLITTFILLFAKLNPSLIRCQLFSFFFFSLFLFIFEKERKYGTKLIWLIPPITILWNNIHGGVVAGLGLVFMYMIGEFLNKKPWKRYLKILGISFPLLIINPYGYKYLTFLFSATTMNRKYITEWWPFYSYKFVRYYIMPSLFLIFGFVLNIVNTIRAKISAKKIDYTKLIVVSVCVIEGLAHIKLLSLGLIAVMALCGNDIFKLFTGLKKILKPLEKSVYYVIFFLMFTIPLYSPAVPRISSGSYPLYEVEFLKLNNIKGNIVVPFGQGSYVSYKLYPDNLIYMDGRYEEVYNNKEFLMLRDFELAEDNWRDLIKNYNTQIVMTRRGNDIYEVLRNDSDWVHIFDGRLSGIFVKKEDVKENYIEPDYNMDYYRKTMFVGTYFGQKLKRKQK